MNRYQAPAKLNLSLLVKPPRDDGYHPLESLVQTVEWCDLLDIEQGDEATDTFDHDIEDNLVERALAELRRQLAIPPLRLRLVKEIPIEAGLGGGSSDAAAALLAASDLVSVSREDLARVGARVGADVPLFFTGGTLMMGGVGDVIDSVAPLDQFAVAVVVPEFGLNTKEVYDRWDRMEGPEGSPVPDDRLPPSLRGGMPMRNDLLPAALDLEPRLGDFIAEVAAVWGTSVSLTGSGSACFGYFASPDEASDAASAVADLTRAGRGVELRSRGVARLDTSSVS